ncbi:MAG: XdhC family protein [Candidatus Thorarchaeota archaeon]
MSKDFFKKVNELNENNKIFAIATVVKIEGSASAKPGAKAIIDDNGKMIQGWVGGGCAESTVSQEALNSFKDGKTRLVSLDLDDEVLGVGMPCGGTMEVYIEPFIPKPELIIFGHGRIVEALVELGYLLNFSVIVSNPLATKELFPKAEQIITDVDTEGLVIGPQTYVVVASQHKNDHFYLKKALESKAPYIALIASKKRTELTFSYVIEMGISPEELKRVRAPAGIDLGGIAPEEIALSVISEIVANRHGGSSRPLMEVKGPRIPDVHAKIQ